LGDEDLTQFLPKVEQNYLNCFTSKVISYLKVKDVPIELLLYRAYEDTKDTFDQFLLNNKKRWQCKNSVLDQEDLKMMDINVIQGNEVDFSFLKDMIEQKSESQKIFVTCDVFHLAHRKDDYLQQHNSHWVMVAGRESCNSNALYSLLDDNSNGWGDFTERLYHEEAFRIAFESNSLRSYRYYNVNTNHNEINFYTNIFIERAREYLSKSSFSLYHYDQIPDFLLEKSLRTDHLSSLLDQLIEGLAYLSGSRYLFHLFLSFIHDARLQDAQVVLQNVIELMNNLKLILLKAKVTNKLNASELRERFRKIKENEMLVLENLKYRFLF
jgi:hypothetical protein